MRTKPTTRELLLEGDWSNCTYKEIAKAIGRHPITVENEIRSYEEETGKIIPHVQRIPTATRMIEMDCTEMTAQEIADTLGVHVHTVYTAASKYYQKTGKLIPYKRDNRGRRVGRPTVCEQLLSDDWSDLTLREIADTLDVTPEAIYLAMKKHKRETGEEIPYKKAGRNNGTKKEKSSQ